MISLYKKSNNPMKTKYIFAGIAASILTFSSCSKKADTGVKKDTLEPNQAVEQWAKDMTKGQIVSLWDSIPASYQTDIEGLAHDFGAKVDTEIYNESIKTLTSISSMLKNKKEIIIEIINENTPAEKKEEIAKATENYDSFVDLINAIVSSKIKDTEGLKTLNVQEFLGEIQPQVAKVAEAGFAIAVKEEKNAWMNDPKCELISKTDDTAEVKDPASTDGKTIKLSRVEDRWVPTEMVTDWSKNIEEAKKGIASMEAMEPMQKQMALGIMRALQASAKKLEDSATKEEFMKNAEEAGKSFGNFF